MSDDEPSENPRRGIPLSEAFAGIDFDQGGRLAEAFKATSEMSERLSAVMSQRVTPSLRVPEVTVPQIDWSRTPEARTARATEDMVERLDEYQGSVAALVAALQAEAVEQRERAERAEAREQQADVRERKMLRLTQISVVFAFLALLAAVLVPLVA